MKIPFLIGRLAFSGFFLYNGINQQMLAVPFAVIRAYGPCGGAWSPGQRTALPDFDPGWTISARSRDPWRLRDS
jgi:hypothetical protein